MLHLSNWIGTRHPPVCTYTIDTKWSTMNIYIYYWIKHITIWLILLYPLNCAHFKRQSKWIFNSINFVEIDLKMTSTVCSNKMWILQFCLFVWLCVNNQKYSHNNNKITFDLHWKILHPNEFDALNRKQFVSIHKDVPQSKANSLEIHTIDCRIYDVDTKVFACQEQVESVLCTLLSATWNF